MAGFLTSVSASLATGTKLITISGNVDCSFVVSGTAVYLNNILMEGVSGTSPDPSGNSTITLRNNYTGSSIVNGTLVSFNTIEGLRDAIQRARELAATQVTNNEQLELFLTSTGSLVDLELPSGTTQVLPYKLISELTVANEIKQYAMSQAQFEAIRVQNKGRYAASGWVSFGNHESGKQVNECKPGLYTSLTTPNTLLISKDGGVGGSKTDHGVLCVAGVIFDLPIAYQVMLAQAPDGKTTYNKSTGVITNHSTVAAAFNTQAADPVNIEVVINRVDMWGFEAFQQEVTPANPEIYPQGVFSDLFTSMNGILTSDSARPVSYFGFLGKKAKKVDFFALSDAQKKKVLADTKNNLYYSDDGRLIQWVLRGREFAGAGNGDWLQINSLGVDGLFANQGNARFLAQGVYEVSSSIGNDGIGIGYLGFTNGYRTKNQDRGIFSGRHPSLSAIEGECYFIVGGTVKRLNQGAFHPSFNPSGTKAITDTYGDQSTSALWHNVTGSTKQQFTSTAAAFDPQVVLFNSGYIGNPLADIGIRPDGRFYDATYSDGDGGVCRDMRYSAYGVTSEDFSDADQLFKNMKYRGFELLPITVAGIATPYLSSLVVDLSNYGDVSQIRQEKYTLTEVSTAPRYKICNARTGQTIDTTGLSDGLEEKVYLGGLSDVVAGDKILVLANNRNGQLLSKSSVGGSFLQIDVFGTPVVLLATPALANGWTGGWGGMFDGTQKRHPLTRESLSSASPSSIYTDNNGGSWLPWGADIDTTANVFPALASSDPAGRVAIVPYKAFAKQTEPTVNAAVHGGRRGVGVVYYSQIHVMSLLSETFFGKILNSRGPNAPYEGQRDTEPYIIGRGYASDQESYWGKLAPSGDEYATTHSPIILGTPSAEANTAFKVLNYNANINQQAFIQYAYTELKHNGTNWGDDDKVTIVDNQSTKTDLNGNTILVGTAKLKEPIGWIKLKV